MWNRVPSADGRWGCSCGHRSSRMRPRARPHCLPLPPHLPQPDQHVSRALVWRSVLACGGGHTRTGAHGCGVSCWGPGCTCCHALQPRPNTPRPRAIAARVPPLRPALLPLRPHALTPALSGRPTRPAVARGAPPAPTLGRPPVLVQRIALHQRTAGRVGRAWALGPGL